MKLPRARLQIPRSTAARHATSVHTAWFVDNRKKMKPNAHRGFTSLNRGKWSILVPRALNGNDKRMGRVVILDDCVVTGLTLAALREHLIEEHGYTPERILGACCVRAPNPVVPWDKRDAFAFLAQKQDFTLPWGPGSSFEAQIFG